MDAFRLNSARRTDGSPCTPSPKNPSRRPSQEKPGVNPPLPSRIPCARIRSLRLRAGNPHLPRSLRRLRSLVQTGPLPPCVLDRSSPLATHPVSRVMRATHHTGPFHFLPLG